MSAPPHSRQVALGAGTAGAADIRTSSGIVESAPAVRLATLANDLDVSLVKTDTDGFDQDIVAAELEFLRSKQPILWLEAQTMSAADESKWRSLLGSMAETWPKMILFDNFGFAIAVGDTADLPTMPSTSWPTEDGSASAPIISPRSTISMSPCFQRASTEYLKSSGYRYPNLTPDIPSAPEGV